MPPCHPEEKAEAAPEDDGGTDGGKAVDEPLPPVAPPVAGGKPVANPFATSKSFDSNGKSAPVAGWQRFSGGIEDEESDDGLTIPTYLRRCTHCGQAGGEEWDWQGRKVWLHSHCEAAWVDAQRSPPITFTHPLPASTKSDLQRAIADELWLRGEGPSRATGPMAAMGSSL